MLALAPLELFGAGTFDDPSALGWRLLLSYLLGAVPFGLVMCRTLKGVDPRSVGSGNIGATNAFRVLGRAAGTAVLLVDAAKGAAAVLVCPVLAGLAVPGAEPAALRLTAALGAVLGHNYTCWLGFRGGKGIATSAGVLAALVPAAFGITLAAFLATLALSRIVSLSSVAAAVVLPFAVAFTPPGSRSLVILTTVLSVVAIIRHRANLGRLLAGTEPRIGRRAPEAIR